MPFIAFISLFLIVGLVFGVMILLFFWAIVQKVLAAGKADPARPRVLTPLQENLIAHGERGQAMVVFHTRKRGRFNPKVKFTTPDGRVFKHLSGWSSPQPWPAVGTKVEIFYDAKDPEIAAVIQWPQPRP